LFSARNYTNALNRILTMKRLMNTAD